MDRYRILFLPTVEQMKLNTSLYAFRLQGDWLQNIRPRFNSSKMNGFFYSPHAHAKSESHSAPHPAISVLCFWQESHATILPTDHHKKNSMV
jgi:hypothetical protein